jgi:hypothetical protein
MRPPKEAGDSNPGIQTAEIGPGKWPFGFGDQK